MENNGIENGTRWWTNWPWRFIQTNLREIDMLDVDAKQYIEDLKSFEATVLMINTSGIISSYFTELPFHHQSQFLKGDSLQKIIEECHKENIKVFARTDFSKVRREIYEAHPEWAYITPQGEIVDYNGDVHVCLNGGYQQEYAFEIIKETLEKLDVDGIFFNMGGYRVHDYSYKYHGICHCESCGKKFYDMFKLHLPEKEDMEDPVFRKYVLFKKKTLGDSDKKVYDFIHNMRPDICIANKLEFNSGLLRQESNTAIDRPLPHWQYSASDNTKWVISSYPGTVSSNTTVDFIDFPYRHAAVSPFQQKLRLVQNLANAGGLDYYLIGRLDNHEDRSGYKGIKEVFHYHAKNEKDYMNLTSKSAIGLLCGSGGNEKEYRGWFRFLIESHFQFDTLKVENILNLNWDKYKALIVPDHKVLSDELISRLDRFAKNGGTVISVSESGFMDSSLEQRQLPSLKCLGIDKVNTVRLDMRSSMFKIDDKKGFNRFTDSELIYMDSSYVYADYDEKTDKYLKLIPPHMWGPPERCYYTDVIDYPCFTIFNYGKGRGVYIPWKPGALYYRQGYTNTLDFAADLLENILGLAPIKGNLSPMVEVTLFTRTDNSFDMLHLVNGTGHFGVTFFEPVNISDIEVNFECEDAPKFVKSLVTGEKYKFNFLDGKLNVKIPSLGLFDAVKITK